MPALTPTHTLTPTLLIALTVAACDPHTADPYASHHARIDPSSEACGQCHVTEYAAWAESPHGQSSASPVFRALVSEVRQSWGEAAADRCEGCHAPGHDGSDRVGCVSCHMATGNRATRDGLLVVALEGAIASPHRPSPTAPPPHPTRPGTFLSSSTLCGTCHEVTGPEHFIEHTYSEFLASPENAAGQTCQTCHMPRDDMDRASHRLASVTPAFGATPTTLARRRDDARQLLASGLALALSPTDQGIALSLTNVAGGHHIPTGATLIRELWVEVHPTPRSSDPGPNPPPTLTALTLGARMTADTFEVPLPTEADQIHIDSLAPGETRTVTLPPSLTPPLTATLYLRPVRADLALALGLDPDHPELAPLQIARVTLE